MIRVQHRHGTGTLQMKFRVDAAQYEKIIYFVLSALIQIRFDVSQLLTLLSSWLRVNVNSRAFSSASEVDRVLSSANSIKIVKSMNSLEIMTIYDETRWGPHGNDDYIRWDTMRASWQWWLYTMRYGEGLMAIMTIYDEINIPLHTYSLSRAEGL